MFGLNPGYSAINNPAEEIEARSCDHYQPTHQVMSQAIIPNEAAKVLVDDAIQALKNKTVIERLCISTH